MVNPNLLRDPDYRDVEGLMKSASYWPADNLPKKQALAREQANTGAWSAVAEWKRLTGWAQFLVAPDAPMTTREYTWNGKPVLQLHAGFLELASVTIDGQPLDASIVRKFPQNALTDNRPHTALTFSRRYAARWRGRVGAGFGPTIEVTARWGYCYEYPGDVWQQILQAAGLITLTQIENFQSLASLSQQGFSKAWDVVGIITQKDTAERWRKEFPATIARYKRQVVS